MGVKEHQITLGNTLKQCAQFWQLSPRPQLQKGFQQLVLELVSSEWWWDAYVSCNMVASCNDDSKLSRCMIYMLGIAETLFLEFSPGHQKIMNRRVSYTYVIVFAMNQGSLLLSQKYPSNSKSAVNLYEFRYGCWDVAEKVGRKSGTNTAKRKRECLDGECQN